MSFIKHTAHQIWHQFGAEVDEHLFLFPSRRSMLYFKKEMVEAAGQNLWMPDCLTLEEWVFMQTDLIPADPVTLTFHLYEAAIDVKFTLYGFEEFYPLAQTILSDFEEVDMQLVDPEELWLNTAALQDLPSPMKPHTIWQEMKDSPLKQRWQVNWNRLLALYKIFNAKLMQDGLSGKGQIYRSVVRDMKNHELAQYPRIHAIGFSTLTRSEINILDYIRQHRPVLFYWNIPPQMKMPGIDVGSHVLELAAHFGQALEEKEYGVPVVEIINTSGILPQMKLVSQMLDKSDEKEENMAVLLPHPSLIDIFLTSFPDARSKVNVSLGYPLIYSPARSLLEWIIGVWEDVAQLDGKVERSRITRLWTHVYIHGYVRNKKLSMPESGQLYFRREQWDQDDPLLNVLFDPEMRGSDSLSKLIIIIDELIPLQSEVFHREVLRYVRGRLIRLNDVLMLLEGISFVFLKRILFEMFQAASVPFRGEPMEGVQVLGIQEAQNLAFDTLFIPGMNEEVLPAGSVKSLIPFSLRRHYGLSDQGDRMRTQSYYIWSAILNAEKVFMLYSNNDDLLGAKGMSRYLFQLKYGDLKIPFLERHLDLGLDSFEPGVKEIHMTADRQVQLREYLQQKGLSPSALMMYLRCPFQFYLSYVLGIKEDMVPVAGLDHRDMGTGIHEVMDALYKPYKGVMTSSDFDDMKERVVETTRLEYQKMYPSDPPESLMKGVHWMEQEIIIRAVHRFLEYDSRLKGLEIELLEEKVVVYLSTDRIENVRLSGKIDRLDRMGDRYRIIDYKTGTSDLNTRGIEYISTNRSITHNWQLLFYAYLIKDQLEDHPFEMGHYTLRDKKVYNPLFTSKSKKHSVQDIEKFEGVLQGLIDEMLDPEVPFRQTEKTDLCRYCEFNAFCERQEAI